jgi:hypothetical protein
MSSPLLTVDGCLDGHGHLRLQAAERFGSIAAMTFASFVGLP